MYTCEVSIEVLHSTEGVVSLHIPWHLAVEGAFPFRVIQAHAGMLLHAFLDSKVLTAVGAGEGLIWFWSILTMGHFMVLPHPLSTGVALLTVRALDLLALDTSRLVCP